MSASFMRKILCFVCFALPVTAGFSQQENIDKGWNEFNKNNRKEAAGYFQQATSDPAAYLDLCLVNKSNHNNEEAFNDFLLFYKNATNPYPYIYALWSSEFLRGDGSAALDKPHVDFFEQLRADAKAGATLRAMANAALGSYYESVNDYDKAKTFFKELNVIDQWSITGSFDNLSGSGFDKDFGVLAHPQSDAVFKNDKDADVKWFAVKNFRNDRWLDFAYNFYPENMIVYAQSFVNSNIDQTVNMMTGVSGSLKIWVNDQLVIREEDERNTDLDVYNSTVKLHKGYNRILVQVGSSEISRSNFMIRLLNTSGDPLNNITYSAAYQPYSKETDFKPVSIPLFAEQYFISKTKEKKNDFTDRLMLAETYLKNEKILEARKALEAIRAQAPLSAYVASDLIRLYKIDNNTTGQTREEEFLKKNDPDNYESLLLFWTEASKKEDYNEADRYTEKIAALYGSGVATALLKLATEGAKKDMASLIKDVNDNYTKYPGNYYFTYTKYLMAINQSKDVKSADGILEKYLQHYENTKFRETLISDYFKIGNKSAAEKMMQSCLEQNPFAVGYFNDFAKTYYQMQDYKTALSWQQRTLEMSPYNSAYYDALGSIYEAMNEKQSAMDAYNKSIYYNPANYDTRKKIQELKNDADIFDNVTKFDADSIFTHAPDASAYPNDNSIILLNDKQKVVYNKGASEERVTVVAKILNQAGIDDWKESNIDYNPYTESLIVERAEVLKKDGSKVKAETNDGDLVFTSLEPGDGVSYTYRIKEYNKGRLSAYYWDNFHFDYFVPVQCSRYTLILPASQTPDYKLLNTNIQPLVKQNNGLKLYTWQTKDLPAIQSERYMPPFSDIGQRLEISSIPDWSYIADWYSDVSSKKADMDFDINAVVDTLLQGKQDLSELEKAKRIYAYIVKHVNYSDVSFLHSAYTPQRASRTLNTRLGDCKDLSTLYVAMAKIAGLKSSLVLVDTRENGDDHLLMPGIGFNHCIATVRAEGKDYLVELTNPYLPFGALSAYTRHASGLYIPRPGDVQTGNTLVKLTANTDLPETTVKHTLITIGGTDINVKRHCTFNGSQAASIRYSYANAGKDDQYKTMLGTVSGDFKTSITIDSLHFTNLQNLEDSVSYDLSFTVKDDVNQIAGMSIIKLPWTDAFGSMGFLTQNKRNAPFEIWQMGLGKEEKEIITLPFPSNTKLAEIPKDIHYTCGALTYSITYKITPKALIATRELSVDKDRVNTGDYDTLKDFFTKVSIADSKQYAIK